MCFVKNALVFKDTNILEEPGSPCPSPGHCYCPVPFRASSCKRSTKDSTPASVSVAGADSASSGGGETQTVSFSSGNPFVEVTRGILHLYKENHTTSLEEGVIRSQMLCMLGVPAKHKTPDLLQFTAPCHSRLEMMRIINDGSPNQFMVLLRYTFCMTSITSPLGLGHHSLLRRCNLPLCAAAGHTTLRVQCSSLAEFLMCHNFSHLVVRTYKSI